MATFSQVSFALFISFFHQSISILVRTPFVRVQPVLTAAALIGRAIIFGMDNSSMSMGVVLHLLSMSHLSQAPKKAEEKAEWLQSQGITEEVMVRAIYRYYPHLIHLATQEGVIVDTITEMRNSKTSSPFEYILGCADAVMTARHPVAAMLLEPMGYDVLLYLDHSRLICVDSETRQELVSKVELMGSGIAPEAKVNKGLKYAKVLFGPMSLCGVVDIKPEQILVVPEATDVPEGAIDGQVLVTWALIDKAIAGGYISQKMARKMAKLDRNKAQSMFIGRLLEATGMEKGGFVIVPTHWLSFLDESGRRTQYHIMSSERKTEVKVDIGNNKAILCAASNLKLRKTASTDLQNFLMSLEIRNPELREQLFAVVEAAKDEREDLIQSCLDRLEEELGDVNDIALTGEITEDNSKLNVVLVAKAFKQAGIDIEAVPALFVDLLNRAGDGSFDPDRFRLPGEIMVEGERKVWRESWYLQAHFGRTLLAVEAMLGQKGNWSCEERRFFQSWECIGTDQIMVPAEVAAQVDKEVYVTRRPMTYDGGAPMDIIGQDLGFCDIPLVAPCLEMQQYLMEANDGADQDDSFEINYGAIGQAMIDWHHRKSDIRNKALSGYKFDESLKPFKSYKLKGYSIKTLLYPDKDEMKKLRKVLKGYSTRFRDEALVIAKELKANPQVNCLEHWQSMPVTARLGGWVGSAANAQMFATFILQGFLDRNHIHYDLIKHLAAKCVSEMLSNIVDAQTQGKNVPEAAEAIRGIFDATNLIAFLFLDDAIIRKLNQVFMPEPMKSRAMWAMGRLVKGGTHRATVNVAGEEFQVRQAGKGLLSVNTKCWPAYEAFDHYTDWLKDKVQGLLAAGKESGAIARLSSMADADFQQELDAKQRQFLGEAFKHVNKAKAKQAERYASMYAISNKSDSVKTWANEPVRQAMIESLGRVPEAGHRGFMLLAVKAMATTVMTNEQVIKWDASKRSIVCSGVGAKTAWHGEVLHGGKKVAGLYTHLIKWLLERKEWQAPETVTLRTYVVDKTYRYWSDENAQLIEEYCASELGSSLPDVVGKDKLLNLHSDKAMLPDAFNVYFSGIGDEAKAQFLAMFYEYELVGYDVLRFDSKHSMVHAELTFTVSR